MMMRLREVFQDEGQCLRPEPYDPLISWVEDDSLDI